MKKISMLLAVLLSGSAVFAHELPVPHGHEGPFHGFETVIILAVVTIALAIFGAFRLSKRAK